MSVAQETDQTALQAMDARCERWGRWRREQQRFSLDCSPNLLGRLVAESSEARRRQRKCICGGKTKRRVGVGLVCEACGMVAPAAEAKVYANLIHGQGPKPEPENEEAEETDKAIRTMPRCYQQCAAVLEVEYDPRYSDRTISDRARVIGLKPGTYRDLNRRALSYLVGYFAANPGPYWNARALPKGLASIDCK